MMNSMTGYGEAGGELAGVSYAVEIKTVNHRYYKSNIKLPVVAAFLEEDIERLLRENLSRGAVNYTLRLKNVSANVLFNIDEPALQAIMERLGRVGRSSDVKCSVDMAYLLTLPGVLAPVLPDEETVGQIREMVLGITRQASKQLKQMRAAEGALLEADLKKHCEAIKQLLEQIRARSAVVPAEYTDRLKRRVNELLAEAKLKLDEETLAREVAVFADRSDISEEITRLDAHLQQFAESYQAGGPEGVVGRRLDFISQEMLREANTIASKASDIGIARSVVDMKCRIDRIKEQAQNVE